MVELGENYLDPIFTISKLTFVNKAKKKWYRCISESQRSFCHSNYIVNKTPFLKSIKVDIFQNWQVRGLAIVLLNAKQKNSSKNIFLLFFLFFVFLWQNYLSWFVLNKLCRKGEKNTLPWSNVLKTVSAHYSLRLWFWS